MYPGIPADEDQLISSARYLISWTDLVSPRLNKINADEKKLSEMGRESWSEKRERGTRKRAGRKEKNAIIVSDPKTTGRDNSGETNGNHGW